MAVATQTMTYPASVSCISINTARPLKRSSSSLDLDLPLRASKAPRIQSSPPPPMAQQQQQQRASKPMPLRRQTTFRDLSSLTASSSPPPPAPLKRKVAPRAPVAPPKQQFPTRHPPRSAPINHPSSASAASSATCVSPAARTSSPLSPNRSYLPARPIFPRSKNCVNLYRQALSNLRCTAAEKSMSQPAPPDDVVMSSEGLAKGSWIVVPETEDWDEDWDMEEVCRI